MNEEDLKKLFEPFEYKANPTPTLAILIHETVRLRDQLKKETGRVLTVADTQAALEALTVWLSGRIFEGELSEDQQTLLEAWKSRLLE